MKLNSKILISNTILTLVVFVFTSIGIYYLVNKTVFDELDNHLLQHKIDIINQIGENGSTLESITDLGKLGSYEWIEISEYDGSVAPSQNHFATIDTLRNPEKEVEPNSYRQLTTTVSLNDRYYTLQIHEEIASWANISTTILMSVLAGLMIWILLLYVFNQFVLDRILTPFYKTVDTLETISDTSDLDESFPVTTTYEVNVLNQALNSMMQHIRTSFEDQKHFIQNVSHELLTPLSIIRQKAEIILSEPESMDRKTIESVSSIQHTAVRLSRLSNALLLISRVENRQFALDEQIAVCEVVDEATDELRDFIEMKEIDMKKEFGCSIPILGNTELIHAAVYNIIQNAVKFSPAGSSITLITSCEEEKPCFLVRDQGPGIPPEFIDSVFDRFKKNKNHIEGAGNGSPGLGLSIVQSICRLHNFECAAKNRPNKGAEISICF